MSTYKPIVISPTSYSGGARASGVSLPAVSAKKSPSSIGTGGTSGGVSLVPYSSPAKALEAQVQKKDVGVVGRTFATFGDLAANILVGAAKSLEGVVDFGMTAAGAVGGVFSDEFQSEVRRLVEYDFVGDRIADPLEELTESSYLNELRIGGKSVGEAVELIAQGVGGMLPSIGLAALTGGGSLAAQLVGTGSMMVGAAGNATEEAMNRGAGYGSAAAYGLTRGAIEGATEYLGGITLGGGTSLAGKALAGTTLGKATQKGVGRVAYNFISEGAEEALSDLTDPLAKYLTGVDKNVGENYNDTIKGLPQTFLVGGSVGTVLGAGQSFLRSRSRDQQARGGSAAVRADFYIRDAVEQAENFGSVDASHVAAAIRNGYEGASYQLMQMDPEKRAKYLESIGVHKLAFNEDGTLSAKAAEDVNPEAVSSSLRAISGNLAHAPITADVQVSESAKTAKETVLKAIGKNANVVITDAIEGNNAVYNPDEDVIYLSNGALDESSFNNEDVARAVALHEVAHKAEGTKAYLAMADELWRIAEDENAPADVKVLLGDVMARHEEMVELYSEDAQNKNQEKYIVKTELVSNMIGDLLGNSYFVERMGARNDGAWKRFVLALKAADLGKAAGVSKETQKYLSGLYKSYVKAVDEAGRGVRVSSIVDEEEKEKAAEGAVDERASLKKTKISTNMSESERYEALKERKLHNVPVALNLSKVIATQGVGATSWEDINKYLGSDKRVLVRKIASEFGAIGKEYFNQDIQLSFEFSGNNFEESYSKQKRNFIDFARMFSVFDAVVKNAIGVEVHKRPTYKFDPTLENMFVLISAYQYDGFVVPIKLEIKQFNDKPNALYVAISLNKIKMTEVSGQGNTETGVTQSSRSVIISIADIFKKINPSDKSFLKYIPDNFLNEEQKTSKRKAFSEDENKNSVQEKPKNERNSKQSRLQKAKTKAEYTSEKVYSKKEARETFQVLVDSILEDHELMLSGDVKNVAVEGGAKEKIIDRLTQKLNSATKSNRGAVAFEIADEMLGRLMMKVEAADSEGTVTKSTWRVKDVLAPRELIALRQGIIKDILNAFDEKGKPSTLAKTKEKYKQQIALLKKNVRENNVATRKRLAKAAKRAESVADLVNDKKYSKEVARNVIDKMQPELVFGDVIGVIDKKTFDDTVSMLWANLNSASPDKRGLAAFEVVSFLIDNTVVVMKDENGNIIETGKELRFSDAIAHDKLSQMELNSFRQKFVKEILDTFDEKGENTKLATVKASYKAKLDYLSKKVREEKRNVISRLDKAAVRAEKFADSVNERVYSKEDAARILESMEAELVFGESLGVVNGVSRNEVVKALWAEMNSAEPGERAAAAFNVADFVIENTTVIAKDENGKIFEGGRKLYLADALGARELASVRQHLAIDVLNAFDERGKPSKLANTIKEYTKKADFWKKKASEERDIAYKANRVLEKTKRLGELADGSSVGSTMSKTMFTRFKCGISLLARIRYRGNLNKRSSRRLLRQFYEWYTDKENKLVHGRDGVFSEEIADILKALSQNERTPTDEENKILSTLIEQFKTADLRRIYESYTEKELGERYDKNVKALLRELSVESPFSIEELRELEKVVDHFTKLVRDHNKVFRNDKYVDAPDLARDYIKRFTERKREAPGAFRKWFEAYYVSYGDPMALARYMDSYDKHGFFTETLEEIRRAGIKAAVREMKIRAPLEKFYKKNPKFLGNLKNKRVKDWNGVEIPLANAISLYMTLGREQAIRGLARKGYVIQASKDAEKVRLQGFMPLEEIADDQLAAAAKEARDNLYKQFTEGEKTFISLVEAAFEECKKAKYDTDMIRHGYSNVIAGYYFPIARAYVSHSIDSFKYQDEMDAVSSKSFNKDTVTNAEGELFINAVDAIFNRHVRGVTQYAELSLAVDTFDVLYSLNVNETPGKVESIATESEKVWGGSKAYFEKLVRDVQGLRTESKDTLLAKLLPTIRSGYAKYLLGANPKVWVTQLSSLAASTSILDAGCIVKGFSISAKDVDEYCALAQLRNTENTAALAQGVLEKASGFGDALMKPIGAVDRLVIERLFAACQVQVDKNGAAKLGTKENKVAAGELLERVILETQQNSLATERSAAMRSENEIEKTITMFSADAMKVFGRVVDAFGEAQTLRRLLKLENDKGDNRDSAKIERYQRELKRAGKKLARSVSALLSSAVMMALIAQLVRRLLNKKDKDEAVENIVGDVAGNLIGGLPLIRDVVGFFTDGYDIDYYAFSAMNDLLGSVSDIVALSRDTMEGEWDAKKTAKAIRSAFYSAGMVLGVPTRNIYNYSYAAINIVSPETGYKMDDLFYSKSYRADLAAAVEKGDDGMVATIAGLMLDDGVGGMTDKELRKTMRDLIAAGFDVVPKSVRSSFTYEGEVYELDAKQKKAFEKTYTQAHEDAARLVKYKSFASASDAVKAKAVSFVYDLYYDMAIHERVGNGELGKSALFAQAIDVPVLALAVATAKSLESDKDKDGQTVAGSLKKKIHDHVNSLKLSAAQKYMLMGYLGYKNAIGKDKVQAYIRTLKLSEEQKKKLLEASGY